MIYTINLSDNFSEKLVDFILKQSQNPFDLAQMTVILPNKRACQNIRLAFIQKQNAQATLLPKLMPLYELDGLEQNTPPVIQANHRLFLLAQLCAKKPNVSGMDQALKMALSLTDILDEFYQFEINPNRLSDLVPEKKFAEHWNETLIFLDIITKAWPMILKEKNLIDKMDHNIRLINYYTQKWQQNPPKHMIIMAGFNGNIPAVCRLLDVVQHLPKGVIFLNGLEKQVSQATYEKAGDDYFQYSFKKLLDFLKIDFQQVSSYSPVRLPTECFITESLRPAEDSDAWRMLSPFDKKTLQNIHRIECENPDQEALTIALILRQTLETPEKTAALITTDRTLARRVIVEMRRWGILLNDTAGKPLLKTQVGIFLMLLATFALHPDDPHLVALLKHPLSADGGSPSQLHILVKQAEKTARQKGEKLDISLKISAQLEKFKNLFQNNLLTPFETFLKEHIALAEQLAQSDLLSGSERLWNHEDGEAAFTFLTELQSNANLLGEIEPAQYPILLELLMNQIQVRPKYGTHPRLSILGPIESRFSHSDVCVLGGLNDGVWPLIPESGPWLNRPMRQKLGLPSLESKIAESALDFAHNFCAPEVYITRSLKADGTPTIPSRFLSRMEAVAEASGLSFPIEQPLLAKKINQPSEFITLKRPAPTPPVQDRPRRLSVTEIKTWMSDPYSIYAKHILKLKPLKDLGENQKPQFFGSALHEALHQFVSEYPNNTDEQLLSNLFKMHLEKYPFTQTELSFYEPQLKRIAKWFVNQQENRLKFVQKTITEQVGQVILQPKGAPFELVCRADRIDVLKNQTIEIIDYKTGTVPKPKEIKYGYEPQLPLEAYILSQKGFENISPLPVQALTYWKMSGKEGASQITSAIAASDKKTTVQTLTQEAVQKLLLLIDTFDNPKTAYESCPLPSHIPHYNDYAYLARIQEWKHADDEGDDE